MADFCKECYINLMNLNPNSYDFILSKEFNFCDRCKSFKPIVEAAYEKELGENKNVTINQRRTKK